tara:strand:- start:381 stop:1349 length:969 start_codon:yes stop_codon:yes gene_type:complete
MASTYTSRIRLELQADGENPNSWGTILNQNVIDLIDDAFAAYTTVSLSSADLTLSNSDGAADEARSAMLEFRGTVSSDVNVIIPGNSKFYLVNDRTVRENSSTITFKTAAGSGYVVDTSVIRCVLCDGVSVYELGAGVGANLSVATATINTLTATSITVSTALFTGHVSVSAATFGGHVSATSATFSGTVSAGGEIIGTTIGLGVAAPLGQLHISANAIADKVSLTDATSIGVDFSTGQNFEVQLTGNRTLESPSNCVAGQTGSIFLVQDGTGSRTLSYASNWSFVSGTAPTLSTGVSAIDRLDYIVRTSTDVQSVLSKAYS